MIEAFQFTTELAISNLIDKNPLPHDFSASGEYHPERRTITSAYIMIDTLEGRMKASLNDWIIKGIKGEFYPCRPDIFEATYEPVDNPNQSE